MHLTDIPKHHAVVNELTERFISEDHAHVKAFNALRTDTMESTGYFVGFVRIVGPRKKRIISIFLEEEFFTAKYPLDSKDVVLGAVFQMTDGSIRIAINQKTYDLYLNPITQEIPLGVIAHEIGHIVLGHFKKPKKGNSLVAKEITEETSWKDKGTKGVAEKIIIPLLNGSCDDDLEVDTDVCAVQLIGLGPVLAMRAALSSDCHNIGIRMLNHNKMHALLHLLKTQPELFSVKPSVEVEIEILSPEELEKLVVNTDAKRNKKTKLPIG